MEAVFYSLAFGGSQVAPVQLARSLQSLRALDRDLPVFVYLFGEPPPDFLEMLGRLKAEVRPLGDHRAYLARTEPERAELFALDPKLHRWLILEEPDLKACSRLLYIDSDTFFFAPPRKLFERYRDADLYAREEPLCRRSIYGYNRSYLDEEALTELGAGEGIVPVPPFNTGVCLFTREMADAITTIVPRYLDYLFRFLSWFNVHPVAGQSNVNSVEQAVFDRLLSPDAALAYPSKNRWIADQVALWLSLGQFPSLRFADFAPSDVWQGPEYERMSPGRPLPLLCHYYGPNTAPFFDRLQRLSARGAKTQS
ncbi:MAG: hypothetical protein V4444_06180 [Pseudomonadota bacterium]